jgi:hypothetical protein
MMISSRLIVIVFSTIIPLIAASALSSSARAQDDQCGNPPPVENNKLEVEIQGQANLLTRYLGDAALGGKVKSSQTAIFVNYPDAERSRSNAYFEYQVCLIINRSTQLSDMEKINQLKMVHETIWSSSAEKYNAAWFDGCWIDDKKWKYRIVSVDNSSYRQYTKRPDGTFHVCSGELIHVSVVGNIVRTRRVENTCNAKAIGFQSQIINGFLYGNHVNYPDRTVAHFWKLERVPCDSSFP